MTATELKMIQDISLWHHCKAVAIRDERRRREQCNLGPAVPVSLENEHFAWAKLLDKITQPNP